MTGRTALRRLRRQALLLNPIGVYCTLISAKNRPPDLLVILHEFIFYLFLGPLLIAAMIGGQIHPGAVHIYLAAYIDRLHRGIVHNRAEQIQLVGRRHQKDTCRNLDPLHPELTANCLLGIFGIGAQRNNCLEALIVQLLNSNSFRVGTSPNARAHLFDCAVN